MIPGAKFRMGDIDTLKTGPPALGWTVMGWLAGLAWAREDGVGRQWPESGCILCHLMRYWASGQLCPGGSGLSGGYHFPMIEPGSGSSRTCAIAPTNLSKGFVFGDLPGAFGVSVRAWLRVHECTCPMLSRTTYSCRESPKQGSPNLVNKNKGGPGKPAFQTSDR